MTPPRTQSFQINPSMPFAHLVAQSGAVSPTSAAGGFEPLKFAPEPRGRLLHKLLLVFLAISVLPLLVSGYLLVQVGQNYIQNQVIQVKRGIAQKAAANVKSYMDDKRNTLQIIHKSGDFLTMNPARQKPILDNVMYAYPMFMRMKVVDLDGREVTTVSRLANSPMPSMQSDIAEALRRTRAILGDYVGPVTRSADGYPQMTLGVPIEAKPMQPKGVLLATVNLTDLSSLVKDIVIDEKGYVYIVDLASRRLVAHPDVLGTLLNKDTPVEVQAATLAPEDKSTGAMEFADQSGRRFLATYANVPSLQWRVIVQQPIEEAYQASRQMRRQILAVLLAVIVLTVALGVWISRRFVGRVQTLQRAMEQVGEGHFDVPAVPESNDEFGALTRKFISMAASLKDKTQRLVGAQAELQRWNSELESRVQARTRDLKAAQEQLIASEKLAALGQMASVVGHELRNPLAVMNNSVYLLKTKLAAAAGETGLDPKIDKYLGMIESEIGKSNTIIRDVLDFARNRALVAKPVRLDELVTHAIERITVPPAVALERQLTLGDLEVPVDEDEIRQVLVNLMENACQAMTSGGKLFVGTKTYAGPADSAARAEGGYAEIAIADTGCGIPQEHLAKIFAPFFTTKSRGTGLGLAVVKKIIDRHQGQIRVDSRVGEGTRFTIRLPLQRKGEPHGGR